MCYSFRLSVLKPEGDGCVQFCKQLLCSPLCFTLLCSPWVHFSSFSLLIKCQQKENLGLSLPYYSVSGSRRLGKPCSGLTSRASSSSWAHLRAPSTSDCRKSAGFQQRCTGRERGKIPRLGISHWKHGYLGLTNTTWGIFSSIHPRTSPCPVSKQTNPKRQKFSSCNFFLYKQHRKKTVKPHGKSWRSCKLPSSGPNAFKVIVGFGGGGWDCFGFCLFVSLFGFLKYNFIKKSVHIFYSQPWNGSNYGIILLNACFLLRDSEFINKIHHRNTRKY